MRRAQIPFFNTQMGKGAVTGDSELYLGTAALSERDYIHGAIERADLIIAIGHDTVEKPPFLMGDGSGTEGRSISATSRRPSSRCSIPMRKLIGDIGATVTALADVLGGRLTAGAGIPEAARGNFRSHQRARRGRAVSR